MPAGNSFFHGRWIRQWLLQSSIYVPSALPEQGKQFKSFTLALLKCNIATNSVHDQRYEFLCVVDLEASVNESDDTHEVSELPLILLSTKLALNIVAQFHTFVQPQRIANWRNKQDIPQRVLEESPTFPEAWKNLLSFLNRHGVTESNTLAITCGDWDFRAMLPAEQSFYSIDRLPLFENWCNIKYAFKTFTGKKADSMVRMLNVIGQELIGTHHSGIDDARNIASIARWLSQRGYVFKITSDGLFDEEDLNYQQKLQLKKAETKEAAEEACIAKLSAGKTPPQEMFRNDTRFSTWDDDGVPTHLADGSLTSKSANNKRRKIWKAQHSLHEKYLAWQENEALRGSYF